MIFHFIHCLVCNQLSGYVVIGVKLSVGIILTDDLAFKSSCKADRKLYGFCFDFDVAQFQRFCNGLCMITYRLECTRDLILRKVDINHYREAQCDSPSTSGNNNTVDCSKGVNECRNSVLRVGKKSCEIARLHITKDQGCTDCNGNNVNYRCDIMSQRNDTILQTSFDASAEYLLNDVADQEGHKAFVLIIFYNSCCLFRFIGRTKNNSNARDIAGYQRNAKATDDRIRNESDAALFSIWLCAI